MSRARPDPIIPPPPGSAANVDAIRDGVTEAGDDHRGLYRQRGRPAPPRGAGAAGSSGATGLLPPNATFCSFAIDGDRSRGGPYVLASTITIVGYVAIAGLCALRPCQLTISSEGLTVRLTETRFMGPIRRMLRLPEPAQAEVLWNDVEILQIQETKSVTRRGSKTP